MTQQIVDLNTQIQPAQPPLRLTPLTSRIGATVEGVDLRRPLPEETARALRAALNQRRVLFFRDQPVTPTEQVAFARWFGELTPAHPLQGGLDDAHPEVLVLDSERYALGVGDQAASTSYNNRWHTDVTFSAEPPAASVLAAKLLPETGGDTLWADLVGAYRTLSAPLQRALVGLVAVHTARHTFERLRQTGGDERVQALPPARHPVVRIHPETGEPALFVNPTFTSHIEGLSHLESSALLSLLYEHITLPEHVVRWRWAPGDLAIWDNRVTSHYAAADYQGRRVMHRVTVAGDAPRGFE
ncbi:MAG: TauD/TfdA family dioxygenase [Polyangiaceae bacterium]|nr:TauD/TfdA family dioxygenase [Polyangiaceae bacterium]